MTPRARPHASVDLRSFRPLLAIRLKEEFKKFQGSNRAQSEALEELRRKIEVVGMYQSGRADLAVLDKAEARLLDRDLEDLRRSIGDEAALEHYKVTRIAANR